MASLGEFRHADAASTTGEFPPIGRDGVEIQPYGGASAIGYQIVISATATIEIRGGASGSRAAGTMQTLRTVTADELNILVMPLPEMDFDVTANTGTVTLDSWGINSPR